MNFPFYIARRYLFSKKKHNAINIISGISVCGVALATLALVCTLSVFNGFQDMVASFFTAFDPQLKIVVREGKVFDGQDERIRAVCALPEVAVSTETLEENAMVQYKDRQTMAVLKGVEDNFEELTEIGPTKRKKVRIVDFCDTLADILKKAKKEQRKQVFSYGELYQRNYYREVKEKNRIYYELYHLDGTEDIPLDYNEINLVCIRPDGAYEAPATVETALRTARKRLSELDDNFHFHTLRHTYTTNLLSNGAAPKDVQELLGHSDVSTTMNVYAHANREGKRNSARLLDKVVGE